MALLTRAQFLQELEAGPEKRGFNLVFLGMSGSGKSHWSKIFARQFDYNHVEIDELIGRSPAFASLLEKYPGRDMSERMGRFFGRPWNDGFFEKEARYMKLEREIMAQPFPLGSVIDLTGSAIYHLEPLQTLAQMGLIIYLESDAAYQEQMIRSFLNDPKPVCWNGNYAIANPERPEDSLESNYARLLKERAALYERYADVVLRHEFHKDAESATEMVQKIAAALA